MQAERAGLPAEQSVLRAVVALSRALRGAGLQGNLDSSLSLYRALAEIDVRERSSVYWAAHATFVHDPDERAAFDVIFEQHS